MATAKDRFEAIQKQIADKKELKIRIQTQMEALQKDIEDNTTKLAELGITYDSLEELEQLLADKEARVDALLTNMEQQLNN